MAKKSNDIYEGDPEVTLNAHGEHIFTRLPRNSRLNDKGDDPDDFTIETPEVPKPQTKTASLPQPKPAETLQSDDEGEVDPYLRSLNVSLDGATTKTKNARESYEKAYKAFGDEYSAIADILKPKDREPERKRIRNVAMGQAIGQALSAIFGGIYANSKKGYGKIVMPGDFASKTLARAEALKEQGLLEEKEYKKLLSDMNLRKADLKLKKATGDLSSAEAEKRYIEGLIADYNKQTRNIQGKAAQREWESAENRLDRASQEKIAAIRANAPRTNTEFNIDSLSDDDLLVMDAFLPRKASRTETTTDESGTTQTKVIESEKVSWSETEYSSALRRARALKRQLTPEQYRRAIDALREGYSIEKILEAYNIKQ